MIAGGMQGPQDTSFYAMREGGAASRSTSSRQIPAVENAMGFTGGQGATNSGFTFVALKPLNERKVSAQQIIDRLRPKLARIPGAATYLAAGSGHPHRRPPIQRAISVHASGRDHRRSAEVWPTAADSDAPDALASRTSAQTSKIMVCRPCLPMTAQPPHASASPRDHRQHSLSRLRPVRGLHHLHRR